MKYNIQDLVSIIINAAIQSVKNEVWEKLKEFIDIELKLAHPSQWVKQVFSNLQISNVYCDSSSYEVIFQVVAKDLDSFQAIKAQVLDDGNKHGSEDLYTKPGRTALNDQLTGYITHNQTRHGVPVVLVKNRPTKNKKAYTRVRKYKRKNKQTGEMQEVTYQIKPNSYWPIYVKTYLPKEFNRQGVHVMENVMKNSRQQIKSAFDDGIASRVEEKTGIDIRKG